MPSNQNLETPTPTLLEKMVREHLGSSRVCFWDHFEPYLSLIGPVVWILKGFYNGPPPTGASFLPGNQNLETLTPSFLKKIVWNQLGSSKVFFVKKCECFN